MRRLATALTALLTLLGGGVMAGYLLLFWANPDRAADAAPADSAVYVNVYLHPSSGQKMNLFELVARLPGFSDPATLDEKIHDVAQRLLGEVGLDYGADLRPWLGNQVAVAVSPGGGAAGTPHLLLLAAVRDHAAAETAVPRLMGRDGATFESETYRGSQVMISDPVSYALLPDLLLVADTADGLRAALDAEADAVPSLADSTAFASAMRALPADHLASVYLDLGRLVAIGGNRPLGGYATAALALVAEPSGLHLDGDVPFDTASAGEAARRAFALGEETATLPQWMPADTRAEAVVFGLRDSILDLEQRLADDPDFADATDAISQLRALAALGLGISLDRDLLPLFDGEAAVALRAVGASGPRGLLLLRPSDPGAARVALDRMRDALAERGSAVTARSVRGVMVTSLSIPQIAQFSYALVDGVVVAGLDADDVAASIEAHLDGTTLAAAQRYPAAFELAGGHAGNELWVDLPGLLDASSEMIDLGNEFRDILHEFGELAAAASASADHLEVRSVLIIR